MSATMFSTSVAFESLSCEHRKMASIPNCEKWREFFDKLKDLPELWNVKGDEFKNRFRRKSAWPKLLEVYRQIDSSANEDSLKRRLANIRACYRREVKKVQQSERSGAGADDVFIPNLWYFDLLEFLRDQEEQTPGISTIDLEDASEAMEDRIEPLATKSATNRKRKTIGQQIGERNEILKDALQQLKSPEKDARDEAAVYSEAWATQFRKLSETQKIYAKRSIDEILILGQLNKLTLDSVKSPSISSRTSTPFFQSSCSSSPIENGIFIPSSDVQRHYSLPERRNESIHSPVPRNDENTIFIPSNDVQRRFSLPVRRTEPIEIWFSRNAANHQAINTLLSDPQYSLLDSE